MSGCGLLRLTVPEHSAIDSVLKRTHEENNKLLTCSQTHSCPKKCGSGKITKYKLPGWKSKQKTGYELPGWESKQKTEYKLPKRESKQKTGYEVPGWESKQKN